MKHHIYFIAAVFLFTFLISSCSNDKDEMIPVSHQTEKPTNGNKTAFDYLESIPELKDAKIEYTFMSEGISITISSISLKSAHLFIVIDIGEQSSQLFFLEYNNEAKLFIPSVPAELELRVRIYGFVSKPAPILNQFRKTLVIFP
jgi:PBP1b-binding outer membrane lipoprotein LpoB